MRTPRPRDAGDGLVHARALASGGTVSSPRPQSHVIGDGRWVPGHTGLHAVTPGRGEEPGCSCIGLCLQLGLGQPALTLQQPGGNRP